MQHFDVVIIGAGISGISAAYHLQTECPTKTYAILEGRKNIGGTWDLFKYPGIRSDSDMYTLGFSFRPWTNPKAIADGPSIMEYLREAVDDYELEQHIRFNQQVQRASWCSDTALWTIEATHADSGEPLVYTCNFLSMCTGYYKYSEGYTPDFAGVDQFKGRFIHPQKWTEDIDYEDKQIVVIGSGATAITLVPELAKKATTVTMLQRSPTYIVAAPAKDNLANLANKYLPQKTAYQISRWRKILMSRLSFWIARKYPNFMKNLLLKGVKKELGDDFDVDKHFTPTYNPWDQRICLAPDSDFFESLKSGKAAVVTDHIDTFTEKGLLLKSGETLEADIIVSATGLNIALMGGIEFVVDKQVIDFAKTVSYKSMMFSGVPNMAMAFGYTNASWTLKCDLSNLYVCRLLNFMDKNGYQQCCPQQKDPSLELQPWLDFNSSYVLRQIDKFPKQGTKKPWALKQNYFVDLIQLGHGSLEDGVMEFTSPKKAPQKTVTYANV